MKKLFIIIASFLAISELSYGQNTVDDLFKQFAKRENTTSVHIGKMTMGFASLFTETMGVNNIEVIDLEDCSENIGAEFCKAVSELKDPEYETMISSNEDDERTRILVKMEKDYIKEMVILTSGDDNVIVRLKGKIKPEDINKVINEHKDEN